MDLGRWLRDRKKQLEGAKAQVNPFDGGKTYSTVVNNQHPGSNPYVENRIKNAKYGVLANNKQAQDNFLNSITPTNRPEMATFESLKNAPGRIRSNISDAIGYGDIKTDGKGNINPSKPTGLAENIVAPLSNLGQFNPVRSVGDVGQYLDAVSDKSRFNDIGNRIGSATRGMSNFGKVDEDSAWAPKNLSNPVSRNLGEGMSMLGQTANYATPGAGPIAIAGTIASEANDVLQQARAKGENELIANLKGLSSGALQAAVERYSSKFTSGLPGSSAVGKLTSNKLAKIPAALIGGGLTEGAEEFTQGLIGNIARGNEWSEGLKEQTLAGAKGGVMLGGFFGGANYAANRSQGIKQQVEQQNPQLQQTGIPAEPGSIRDRIQQAKENVKQTIAENITPLANNEAGYIKIPKIGKNLPNKPVQINQVSESDGYSKSPVSDSPLSPIEAISDYQDYGYVRANESLRNNKITPKAKHLIDGLDNAFNKIGKNKSIYVHRYDGAATTGDIFEKTGIGKALKQFENIKHEEFYNNQDKIQSVIKKLEGQEFTDKGYLSTSREKAGALKFGDGGEINQFGIPALVRINGETRVIDVANNGFTDIEQELLLPRNTSYKIRRAELMPWLREGYAGPRGEQYLLQLDVDIVDTPGINKDKKQERKQGDFTITEDGESRTVNLNKKPLSGAALQSQLSKQAGENRNKIIYRSGNIDSPRGAFFSSDKDLAATYSTNPVKGESGRSVNEYQINENTKIKKVNGGQLKHAKSIGIDIDGIRNKIQKDYDSGVVFENDNNVQQETLMRVEDLIKQKLEKQGFDGVEYTGDYYGRKHKEYHLFNPAKSIKQDPARAFVGDKDSVRRMELDYIKGKTDTASNSLKGEGLNIKSDQSALQRAKAKMAESIKTLKEDDGGGYDGGRTAQERVEAKAPQVGKTELSGQAKFDAELRAKSDANLKKVNKQITTGIASNPNRSKSPLTDKAYEEVFGTPYNEKAGITEEQATRQPKNEAPVTRSNDKKIDELLSTMKTDKKLTEAARIAQKDGKELNYYAKKDPGGRSVGIQEFNPTYQRIEAGNVVDNKGKILGNHIKVDSTGIQVNVGGEIVNMESIVGNPLDWTGNYKVSSTMERNIRDNAPTKEIADKTYKFVIANKIKSEANLKTDIQNERTALNERVKSVMDSKPRNVKESEYKADIFDFIEENKTQADIAKKYGPQATQSIIKYKTETRKLYDTLLDRVNKEFAKFGERQIPKRKDYITHINELNQQPSFAGEIMGQLQNSIMGEGYQTTRGSVPGSIAGRTETFTPRKRWNPFAQERKGGEFTKDPFKAVDSYLEPTLYNIHMTESAVRARAVESAFRTADQIRQSDASKVKTELGSELAKYNKNTNNGKLISGFQEYANALAGKTQRWDRQIIDASQATNTTLKGWQGLQRVGGRATILGNVNSILMQPLNQVSTLADTSVKNYVKGVARSLGDSKAENLSPFIKARATKAESNFRGKGQKAMDVAGVPMQVVELASVKLAWNAEYEQVLSEGLRGQDAIIEADRRTERVVAGRGIADKPEVYRSTATNGLFQYTLEVSAQNKKFWNDFTPAQKGKFVAGAFAMNQLIGFVSGNEPLPDYLDAAIESLKDWFGDDDETTGEKAIQTGQRFLSETVKFNPFASAAANLFPKEMRKDVFGVDSELSRYEGVPAPIGVIQNAFGVGKNIVEGNTKGARDSALKLVPGGNQIRKTLQGKELIQDGAKYDKNGKVQYEAPQNPLGQAQALLFGPSATKNAREYYDSMSNKLSGISTKKDASGKEIDDFKTIATAAFGTEKGKEFMALTNDDQRKEFARASDENRGIYDQYKAMQKSFSGGDDLLPKDISKESEQVLNKYDRLVSGTKDKIFDREKGAEYEYNKARYERDLLDGKLSEVDKIKRQKSLAKDKIGADYDKSIRETYSMSKSQIKSLLEGTKEGDKIYNQLVEYDKKLYDAGLISYLKFKNGLGSGRGGKGRKSKSKSESYALESQTLANLRRLLDKTTFKGGAKVSTPAPKLAKQKKITVNTKA